ncbi:cytochrome-c peroxidase [Vibrio gallicus]|uniref:cytochrome-c peroxidase n=1 Tax=Vibrio gallicus TaxID=190897 RepID=UPI0021C3069D|nr:cytochrome c peroxidase [Vibrio gallicus]
MRNILIRFATLASVLVLIGCKGSDGDGSDTSVTPDPELPSVLNLPDTHFNYSNIELPEHYLVNDFPAVFQFQKAAIDMDNLPDHNQITDAGATLGRVLFYDRRLSANGTVSCASCHIPSNGFSDPKVLSDGFNGGKTRRHSMGLTNSRFYFTGKFFWDERADSLEEQVLMPFQDPVEMGLILAELEEIVRNQDYYPALFADAFGDATVSSDRISRALAQFVRSMVSTTSKYDIARQDVSSPLVDFPQFTDEENAGKDLFFTPRAVANGDPLNCSGCHISEAFVGVVPINIDFDSIATNNGLDSVSSDDLGVAESTGSNRDIGKFKTPSLRNISVTAPYMHDGRFADLGAVIDHYSTGIQPHPNLLPPLLGNDGNPIKFDFTDAEKSALIAFLDTLTDHTMLNDEKYSNPFNSN